MSKGYIYLDPTCNKIYIACYAVFNESLFPFAQSSFSTNPNTHFTTIVSLWFPNSISSSSSDNDSSPSASIPLSTSNFGPSSSSLDFTTSLLPSLLHTSAPIPMVPPPPPSGLSSSLSNISAAPTASSLPISSSVIPSASESAPNSSSNPASHSSHPVVTRSKHGIYKPKVLSAQHDYTQSEPPSYAITAKHSQWVAAMDFEFQSLQKQKTWSLVPLPANKNVVTCKWVYKLKRHVDGSIARYKARLVARGYLQQFGLDYDETFSPVVKPATVRLLLALAVNNGWELRQLDVSNVFLHGVLKEEVYMRQPQGYVDSQLPRHVCLLHKALYGLKQALRAWFERFTSHLFHVRFFASGADGNLFIYRHGCHVVFLLLYMDDIILTGNDKVFTASIIQLLSSSFDLKDLGLLHYFLGFQIEYTDFGLFVHQTKYATELLSKFVMFDCKSCKTPCSPN